MSIIYNNALIIFVKVSSLHNIIFQTSNIKIMFFIQDLTNQTIQQKNNSNVIENGQSLLLNWKAKQINTNKNKKK